MKNLNQGHVFNRSIVLYHWQALVDVNTIIFLDRQFEHCARGPHVRRSCARVTRRLARHWQRFLTPASISPYLLQPYSIQIDMTEPITVIPPVYDECEYCGEEAEEGQTQMLRCSACKNKFYCVRAVVV